VTALALILRALDALADGEYDLVRACLEELHDAEARRLSGWVCLSDVPDVPDMTVFDEGPERGR
jgi:hypothetical protein